MRKHLSSAALALRRASPPRPFSKGLSGMKLPRCGGRCCTRRYAAQIRARRAKFEPDPSCVCRWDTSVARQWRMNYASPYTPPQRYAFRKPQVCPVSDSWAGFYVAAAQHASNGWLRTSSQGQVAVTARPGSIKVASWTGAVYSNDPNPLWVPRAEADAPAAKPAKSEM